MAMFFPAGNAKLSCDGQEPTFIGIKNRRFAMRVKATWCSSCLPGNGCPDRTRRCKRDWNNCSWRSSSPCHAGHAAGWRCSMFEHIRPTAGDRNSLKNIFSQGCSIAFCDDSHGSPPPPSAGSAEIKPYRVNEEFGYKEMPAVDGVTICHPHHRSSGSKLW